LKRIATNITINGGVINKTYHWYILENWKRIVTNITAILGTLEEIFHIFSWAQLHIHHKPIGLLNVNGFYDNLLSFLDQAMEQEFLTSSARQIIISAATAEQLIDQLQSFIPVIDPSISRINWSIKVSRKSLDWI
jgi:hypothetical protein